MRAFRGCLGIVIAAAGLYSCERGGVEQITAAKAPVMSGPNVAAPTNAMTVPASLSRINIGWQDNASNETGFEVWRSLSGPVGSFTVRWSANENATTYSDEGLDSDVQYCYNVRAFRRYDGKIAYSNFSNTSCATTPAPPLPPPPPPPTSPPAAPNMLSAYAYPWMIMLSWWDNADNEDGFNIEECVGEVCAETDFKVILVVATSPYQPHSIQVSGGMDGGIYQYRVRAFNSAGDSPVSNTQIAIGCIVAIADDGEYYCL